MSTTLKLIVLLLLVSCAAPRAQTVRQTPASYPLASYSLDSADSTQHENAVQYSEPVMIDTLSNVLVYPESAKRAGLEGKVTFEALIGRDGQVWRMRILKSTNALFEKPATEVFKRLRFKPALRQGQPVQAMITQEIVYSLSQ